MQLKIDEEREGENMNVVLHWIEDPQGSGHCLAAKAKSVRKLKQGEQIE